MFEEDVKNISIDAILKKPKSIPRESRVASTQKKTRLNAPLQPPTPITPKETKFEFPEAVRKAKPFYRKKNFWWSIAGMVTLIIVLGLGYKAVTLGQKVLQDSSPFSFFSNFGKLVTAGDKPLNGEDSGEINILLLGIGGEGHEGGTLTDTIILATIKPGDENNSAEVGLLSIPRDLIAKLPDGLEYRKINSAHAYGELKEEGLGATWAIDAVESWVGLTIPYYAVIDFTGFKQAIDDIGGIDVYIKNSFTDSYFPDNRYGYLPPLKFKEGWEHMDGERALQFVRSRHGTNGEGSDFSRSKRQQQVLSAFKDKISKLRISTSLGTINRLLDTFSDNFKTNLEPWEIKRLYDLSKKIDTENISSMALDYSTGLICNEIVEETGAAILTVCPGITRIDVKNFVQNRFSITNAKQERPIIEFQNSTKVNFLASRVSDALAQNNSQNSTTNYPGPEIFEQTVVYDLSDGQKPQTLTHLKDSLEAQVLTNYPYLTELLDPDTDFVVVLGLDAANRFPPN